MNRAGASAAAQMDGSDIMGRACKCRLAPHKKAPGGGAATGGQQKPLSEKPNNCDTVFVANLSWEIDEAKLTEFFADCGTVADIRWHLDKKTGEFRGVGFVEFVEPEAVDLAVQKRGQMLMGRSIRLDYA